MTTPPASALRLAAGTLVAVALAAGTGFWVMNRQPTTPTPPTQPDPGSKPPAVGGVPLFTGWPQDKPELVLVVSGQTFGYLSPCGCSRPQLGGLERRFNFIESLKAKGWPVVGLDLGDLAATKGNQRQNLVKYRTAMSALGAMDYVAVGLGESEFHEQLFSLLAEYTLKHVNQPPFVLAANLIGVTRGADGKVVAQFPREVKFPPVDKGGKPMVGGYEVIARPGLPAVAVIAVVGPAVAEKAQKLNPEHGFQDNGVVIQAALAEIAKHPAKPELFVLLYQGDLKTAQAAAAAFPQFQLVACLTDESEPPQLPTVANGGATSVVQVGHKGRYVGAVGVYKKAGGFELKYQLVPLGEEYLTPRDKDPQKNAEIEKNHKILSLLEAYSAEVKEKDLLADYVAKKAPHRVQIEFATDKPTYTGAAACAKCHPAEYAVWSASKHSHAYEALQKYADRPKLRQFDGECAKCHVTGFEYTGGFESETKSSLLLGNQCENCHGPGSAHAAKPNDKALLMALSPWKTQPTDKLPSLDTLKKLADTPKLDREAKVKLTPAEKRVMTAAGGMCMGCHDTDNDPKFDFETYMPKVYHSGLKAAGLPPGAK